MDNNTKQEQEAILNRLGKDNAERLFQIQQNSYPSGTAYDKLFGNNYLSAEQVFVRSAKRQGFKQWQINLFLQLDQEGK